MNALSLHIEKAGNLKSLLSSDNGSIESLSLTGKLNRADFSAIRSLKNLTHLDISKCHLVGGGRTCIIMDGKEKIKIQAKANELSDYLLVHLESNKEYEEVILPEGIKRIGKKALAGHHALKSITIPDSVEEIDDSAFWCCSGLTHIKMSKGLKRIGKNAFGNSSNLTELEIPASVNDIDELAFNAKTLQVIQVLNPNPPTLHIFKHKYFDPTLLFENKIKKRRRIDINPFDSTDARLIIPKGSLTRYKRAAGWKNFKNIEVDELFNNNGLYNSKGKLKTY